MKSINSPFLRFLKQFTNIMEISWINKYVSVGRFKSIELSHRSKLWFEDLKNKEISFDKALHIFFTIIFILIKIVSNVNVYISYTCISLAHF